MNWFQVIALFAIGIAIALTLQDIQKRVKVIQMKQARLSVTYMKILTELDMLHRANSLLYGDDPEKTKLLKGVANLRRRLLRNQIENNPSVAQLLSGIEFPEHDDDKAFWKGNLVEYLGLSDSVDTNYDAPK